MIIFKKWTFSFFVLKEIKEKYSPQPIDLFEKAKNNEVEDDLRNKKENEQRVLYEKKEKERMKDNV